MVLRLVLLLMHAQRCSPRTVRGMRNTTFTPSVHFARMSSITKFLGCSSSFQLLPARMNSLEPFLRASAFLSLDRMLTAVVGSGLLYTSTGLNYTRAQAFKVAITTAHSLKSSFSLLERDSSIPKMDAIKMRARRAAESVHWSMGQFRHLMAIRMERLAPFLRSR
jgi:hypothetical protein